MTMFLDRSSSKRETTVSHDHNHDHPHPHAHHQAEKDPAEQTELARHLGEELNELFVRYVQGELDFADLTFSTYDVLQDLHIIALGEYELEYDEDAGEGEPNSDSGDGHDAGSDYDAESATEQQEDLAQEPART